MKKIFFIGLLSFMTGTVSFAQEKPGKPNYKTAVGIRFQPFGVSLKSNLAGKKRSIEFVGYFDDGFVLSGMYYWNFPLNTPMNLKFYAGGAGQAGYRKTNAAEGVLFGVGGVVGLDYKFLKLPLNISLDWQPSYQFGGKFDEFQGAWGGIAARFCF